MPVQYICQHCSIPFLSTPSRRRRFCGRRCAALAAILPAETNFWSKVLKTSGCWRYAGTIWPNGYGKFDSCGQTWLAHRYAWESATGDRLRTDQIVCHDCPTGDDHACVRNDEPGVHVVGGVVYRKIGHLWLAPSRAINQLDMAEKGRSPTGDRHRSRTHPEINARGEKNPHAKVTEEIVRVIRRRWAEVGPGYGHQIGIARELNLPISIVAKVIDGSRWNHVA